MNTTYHIGIDLHAKSAAIAWAASTGELEYHGTCSATIKSTERTLRKLARSWKPPPQGSPGLLRGRTDGVEDMRRIKQQLTAFLLHDGHRYSGRSNWTAP